MSTVTAETGLSVSQVARRLERSESTVRMWVRDGRLHGVRTALGVLIDPAEVERVARARERADTSINV